FHSGDTHPLLLTAASGDMAAHRQDVRVNLILCQLQKMGMTPEQIKQATGLSDDELKKITH
ncbi:hypothetical protein GZ993_22800, partial [Salmonella enterica subsp. enterica serovar Infantis]|nr:hypothetical protein [Salmonella enterica subsp. enterica serovar Infantis]